jgi:site-specific DNA-methyltransferase (adenine-specific)
VGGLHELRSYGEPGAMVYLTDGVELVRLMPAAYVDVVFADPPYLLSGGRSLGSFEKDQEWNVRWLREAWRVLKPNGTLWVSGKHHVIFGPGFALQILGFRIINDIRSEYKLRAAGVPGQSVGER